MPESLPNPNAASSRSVDKRDESTGVEDLTLLTRIQSGSQEAMAAFFDRYSRIVYSVAHRVLNDSGEAEDVMQEIFIQVWQKPGAFVSGRGSLAGWLVVVARNRAIDKLRRRRPSDPVELFAPPGTANLAQAAEREILLERVQTAMAKLSDEQRTSIELAFFEGLTHSEIAEKTGEPLGTIKTRIRLALIALRKGLNG